jgi:N-acetylglucosamine-6-phosphate deacetylase
MPEFQAQTKKVMHTFNDYVRMTERIPGVAVALRKMDPDMSVLICRQYPGGY